MSKMEGACPKATTRQGEEESETAILKSIVILNHIRFHQVRCFSQSSGSELPSTTEEISGFKPLTFLVVEN